jgi:predicted RNA binding protein YcfA (HicA-like mRNA interferase family)
MIKPTPHRAVAKLLEDVGFQATRIEDSHVLFRHPATGTTFMLPAGKRVVAVPLLIAMRRTLDEYGLVPRDGFEARLASVVVGRKASA